jgi:hypothetical protein
MVALFNGGVLRNEEDVQVRVQVVKELWRVPGASKT